MKITEKEIKQTEIKTYTYLSTILSGFSSAGMLMFISIFAFDLSEYLEYHNDPDDHGGKLHYVDLNAMWFCGLIGIIFTVLAFFVFRYQFRKIRQLEKKISVIIISFVLNVLFMVICGYLILLAL